MNYSSFLLAAIALSKTLDYYADAETSEMTSNSNESVNDNDDGTESDNENKKKNQNLYDKAGKVTKRRSETTNNNQDGDDDSNIVASNIKSIVVICSKLINRIHSSILHLSIILSRLTKVGNRLQM